MSKEFKIGLLTVVAGALLYYGFNFLRGSDIFSRTNRYYVVYPNVSGLSVSNPVLFNGLRIGRVSDLILEQGRNRIVVAVDVDQKFFVGKLDTASLANNDFFGTKAIILQQGADRAPMDPGDTLKSNIDEDLLSQLEPVADDLKTTITKVNDLLDQLNATDIKGVVDTLKYSIGTITNKVEDLEVESVVGNLNDVVVSFKQRSDQLDTLLSESTILMDSLNSLELGAMVARLNESMDNINQLMNSIKEGEGTVGQLMTNDSVYMNLNKLLVDLDALVVHFNTYPKDFMKPLGRKNKKLRGTTEEGE